MPLEGTILNTTVKLLCYSSSIISGSSNPAAIPPEVIRNGFQVKFPEAFGYLCLLFRC